MPWLYDRQPKDANVRQWHTALKNALLRRIQPDQLERAFKELNTKHEASSDAIATVLFGFRSRNTGTDDPLIFNYANLLRRMKLVGTESLLLALLNTSRFAKQGLSELSEKPSVGLPTCEERMFNLLTQFHMERQSLDPSNFHGLVLVLTRWMRAVTEYEMSKQLEGGALHSVDVFSFSMYEAIASLVITLFGSHAFRELAKQPWWKKRRGTVVDEMVNFDTHVLQWMHSQIGGRLNALATIPPFLETNADGSPIFSDQQILQSVPDLPIANSRAGLYIWLNACLCSRPLTDDLSMFTYLQARYSGNNQSMAVDLLLGSFDMLTNTILRKESEQSLKAVGSFACNKVPHLLSILSGMMVPPVTVETCIQMAFMSITMDILPPISTGAAEVREKLKLTRLECLQACALHGLVSENTIATILQEPPISLPRVTKYTREGLVAQCSNDIVRLEPLIDELEGTMGNAGAIAGCIIDTINHLCVSKETTSLKSVCNMLIKRIPQMDIVMQYTQPANLLLPLCNQLNEWNHDQDQTEFSPAYEEFACILLFIFAMVHRYGLERTDLGLASDDNFMARVLQDTSISKLPSDLTENQSAQLTKWIDGLYATDEHGESSGISDEVMRQCPPQAFYQLVPTLFEQSFLACKAGALSSKAFRGGLELLVEPFLLPSLVGGLSWLIKHSWEDHGDAEILLQVLEKLLKPSISSEETKAMHKAILEIVARPLYDSLQVLAQRRPERKEAGSLMEVLKPHLGRRRTMESDKTEVDRWTVTPDGGIVRCLRNAVRDQIAWISNIGPTPPPKYTHRLFAAGCATVGVSTMLDTMVAELKEQISAGNGPLALDVCTAMTCAPLATGAQAPLLGLGLPTTQAQNLTPTVRDVLRLRTANVQQLLHIPTADAENLVRLGRRVEAQLAVSQIPQIAMAVPMQDAATDQVLADLGLTDDGLAATGADASVDQIAALGTNTGAEFDNAELNAALDQTMDLANMSTDPSAMQVDQSQSIFDDLNLDMTQPNQQLQNADGNNIGIGTNDGQQNADDDIFAGLDMDDLGDFNFS